MHDEGCECDLCHEYSAHEQDMAHQKLDQALKSLKNVDSDVSAVERRELEFAEIVLLNAGFRHPVLAVMFHPPSRLHKFKAGFTYVYLLENEIQEIAKSLRSQICEGISEES